MRNLMIASVILVAAWGCDTAKAPPPAAAPASSTAPSKNASATAADSDADAEPVKPAGEASEVALAIKDYDGIVELIKSHQGKVVVVDCWSTWCEPCMKEFPGLVALHEKHGPDKVACISLSLDYEGLPNKTPEDDADKVLKFLRSQRAAFDNVLSSTPADELSKLLEFPSPPTVFVYDQEGELSRMFPGPEAKYEPKIAPLVEQLLEEEE